MDYSIDSLDVPLKMPMFESTQIGDLATEPKPPSVAMVEPCNHLTMDANPLRTVEKCLASPVEPCPLFEENITCKLSPYEVGNMSKNSQEQQDTISANTSRGTRHVMEENCSASQLAGGDLNDFFALGQGEELQHFANSASQQEVCAGHGKVATDTIGEMCSGKQGEEVISCEHLTPKLIGMQHEAFPDSHKADIELCESIPCSSVVDDTDHPGTGLEAFHVALSRTPPLSSKTNSRPSPVTIIQLDTTKEETPSKPSVKELKIGKTIITPAVQ